MFNQNNFTYHNLIVFILAYPHQVLYRRRRQHQHRRVFQHQLPQAYPHQVLCRRRHQYPRHRVSRHQVPYQRRRQYQRHRVSRHQVLYQRRRQYQHHRVFQHQQRQVCQLRFRQGTEQHFEVLKTVLIIFSNHWL